MSSPSPSPTTSRSSYPHSSPRKSLNSRMRPAPYMVALSGWPEPVYIDSGKLAALKLDDDAAGVGAGRRGSQGSLKSGSGTTSRMSGVEKDGTRSPAEGRRSRSGTPTSTSTPCRPSTKSSGLKLGRVINQDVYPYLHTSTPPLRDGTPPYLQEPIPHIDNNNQESRLVSPLPLYPNHPSSYTHHLHTPPPTANPTLPQNPPTDSSSARAQSRFADPRFTPRASVIGQQGAHLRVVPSWSNSIPSADERYSSIRTANTDTEMEATAHKPIQTDMPPPPLPAKVSSIGVGGRYLQLGLSQGKAKVAILRSTPEVYPPPSIGSSGNGMADLNGIPGLGGMGMATEVYPRDPESGVFWKNGGLGSRAGGRRGSGDSARAAEKGHGGEMEVDE